MAYNTPLQPHSPSRPLSRGGLCLGAQAIAVVLFTSLITFLPSCKPDNAQDGLRLKYFDLKGYFKADTERLRKLNHPTLKSVTHNQVTETNTVYIKNWAIELSLFIQSDINKPAWRDSYQVDSSENALIYRAKTPELKTRELVINKTGGKVKWIMIVNHTKNFLYESTEILNYFPDSLYLIKKFQKVRLMGADRYVVKGTLK